MDWILEIHAHADHLSAAHYLKSVLGGKIAIGDHIGQVQAVFKRLFNLENDFPQDGLQFDHLFADDESFRIGSLHARALFVPGHTPADMAFRKLLSLPEKTRLFMCHDYPPPQRGVAWEVTVGEQRRHNIHIHEGVTEEQFAAMREARDAELEMPVLILPAIQVNIRAGALPAPESNGITYLKIPVNTL